MNNFHFKLFYVLTEYAVKAVVRIFYYRYIWQNIINDYIYSYYSCTWKQGAKDGIVWRGIHVQIEWFIGNSYSLRKRKQQNALLANLVIYHFSIFFEQLRLLTITENKTENNTANSTNAKKNKVYWFIIYHRYYLFSVLNII